MRTNKFKISVSVSENTLLKVREAVRKGLFRNRSHIFEYSVNHVLGGQKDE